MARPLYWEPVWSKIKTVGKTGVIPSGQKIETAAKTGSCPVAVYPCRMTSATLSEARNCAHRESTGQGGRHMDWACILAYATGMVDQELLARNEYLAAEPPLPCSTTTGIPAGSPIVV